MSHRRQESRLISLLIRRLQPPCRSLRHLLQTIPLPAAKWRRTLLSF